MKQIEIEPSVVYEGMSGEQRKVIGFLDDKGIQSTCPSNAHEVRFEVVANPNPRWGLGWKVGSTGQVFLANFAKWARKRVTDAGGA